MNISINTKLLQKILIIRLGKIGDLVLSSFVFSIIKKSNPNCKLYLVTLKKNKDVLKYNTNLDKSIFVSKNLLLFIRLIPLFFQKYDMIIDLNDNPSTTSKILMRIFKGRFKCGFNFYSNYKFLNVPVESQDKSKTHLIERYAYLLSQCGFSFTNEEVKPELFLGEKESSEVEEYIRKEKKSDLLISLNLSAGASIRYYPKDKIIQLIKMIISNYPIVQFVLLCTKEDKSIAEQIISEIGHKYFIPNKFSSFQHFASFIKFSDMIITPDTSAVHIASAFGTPTIALYPNVEWNFVSFAPYKVFSVPIRSKSEKISEISVQEVYDAFIFLLKKIKEKNS